MTLHHTCFVVNDIEKTARGLSERLGIRPWHIWTITPDDGTVNGRPADYSFRVALAQVGGSHYELIEPHDGHSVYVDHLQTKGEGFHHTALAFPSHQAMLSAKAAMISQGRPLIQSGRLADLGEFVYFEIAETGSVIELLFLTELPPPEATIG